MKSCIPCVLTLHLSRLWLKWYRLRKRTWLGNSEALVGKIMCIHRGLFRILLRPCWLLRLERLVTGWGVTDLRSGWRRCWCGSRGSCQQASAAGSPQFRLCWGVFVRVRSPLRGPVRPVFCPWECASAASKSRCRKWDFCFFRKYIPPSPPPFFLFLFFWWRWFLGHLVNFLDGKWGTNKWRRFQYTRGHPSPFVMICHFDLLEEHPPLSSKVCFRDKAEVWTLSAKSCERTKKRGDRKNLKRARARREDGVIIKWIVARFVLKLCRFLGFVFWFLWGVFFFVFVDWGGCVFSRWIACVV